MNKNIHNIVLCILQPRWSLLWSSSLNICKINWQIKSGNRHSLQFYFQSRFIIWWSTLKQRLTTMGKNLPQFFISLKKFFVCFKQQQQWWWQCWSAAFGTNFSIETVDADWPIERYWENVFHEVKQHYLCTSATYAGNAQSFFFGPIPASCCPLLRALQKRATFATFWLDVASRVTRWLIIFQY